MRENHHACWTRRLPAVLLAAGLLGRAAVWAGSEPGGDKPAAVTNALPKEPTVITSERLQVDYVNNVGTFDGNVLAVDPFVTVRADKMVVFYGTMSGATGTNRTLERILATGAVVITQGERKATSEQAEYFAADGKVVLTGQPVLTSKDGRLSGAKITFWRQGEKVEVESGTRLILYPEELRKKGEEEATVTTP